MRPLTIGIYAVFILATNAAMAQGILAQSQTPTSPPSALPAPEPKATILPSPSPSPGPSAPPKLIQLSGYADTVYTKPVGTGGLQFTNYGNYIAQRLTPVGVAAYGGSEVLLFNYLYDGLQLEDLNVTANLNAGNIGGKVEINAGPEADYFAPYPGAFNQFDLTQAYLSYTFGKLTAFGGHYEGLAGAELGETTSDTNVSRSILFDFEPVTLTGGRLTYTASSKVSVTAGINGGWNSWRNPNGRLTTEYQLVLNPSPTVSLTGQGYTGFAQVSNYANVVPLSGNLEFGAGTPLGPPTGQQGQRTLLDFVGTVHATPALTLIANYDKGSQACSSPSCMLSPMNFGGFATAGTTTASWSGLAGYVQYTFSPKLSSALRYEGFHDQSGYETGYKQYWREGTVDLQYVLTPAITLRAEYRNDVSDQPVFATPGQTIVSRPPNNPFVIGTGGQNTTSSAALQAIVHF